MKLNEIFTSIDGEGTRAGEVTTFIRLFKCNIRCSYCDSEYSCIGNDYEEISADDIVNIVEGAEVNNITVTGGEPLIHDNIRDLLEKLNAAKFDVNVETNGTVNPSIYHDLEYVWFTVDYKCPSSKMEQFMNPKAFETLRSKDVLKFVVGSDEDLNKALEIINTYRPAATVYFSPVFGYDAAKIVEFMKEHKLHHGYRVQLQIHKYIWDPNLKGV